MKRIPPHHPTQILLFSIVLLLIFQTLLIKTVQKTFTTTKLIKIKFRKKKSFLDVLTGDSCRKESSSMVVSFSMQSLVRKKLLKFIPLVSSRIFRYFKSSCRLLTGPRPAGKIKRASSSQYSFITLSSYDLTWRTFLPRNRALPNTTLQRGDTSQVLLVCVRLRQRSLLLLTGLFTHKSLRDGILKDYSRVKGESSIEEGDLVLIGDANNKRIIWPLGKVTKMYLGKDGKVRVMEVKTQFGSVMRPIQFRSVMNPLEVTTVDSLPLTERDVEDGPCLDQDQIPGVQRVRRSRYGRLLQQTKRLDYR
ncbi:DUF5641 domain-containing protein [Trichonephila clavipes]|nr:DUF5641 domain-containing protein [Trichonephila clavipes]